MWDSGRLECLHVQRSFQSNWSHTILMRDMILLVSVSSSHVDSLNSFLLAANTRHIWQILADVRLYEHFSLWISTFPLVAFAGDTSDGPYEQPCRFFVLPAAFTCLLAFLWSAINYINRWLAAVPILNLQGAEYAPVFREVLLAPPVSSSLHQAWLAWAASCPTMHFIFPFLPCNKMSLTQMG